MLCAFFLTRFDCPIKRVVITGHIGSGKTSFLETVCKKDDFEDLDRISKKLLPIPLRKKLAFYVLKGNIHNHDKLFNQGGLFLRDYIRSSTKKILEVSAFGTYASFKKSPVLDLYRDSIIIYVEHFDIGKKRYIDPERFKVIRSIQKRPKIVDYTIDDRYQSHEYIKDLFHKIVRSIKTPHALPHPYFISFDGSYGKTIAFYVGSFDPVHKGHLKIAKEILGKKLADYVWIHPVYGDDDTKKRTPWIFRSQLILKALEDPEYANIKDRIILLNHPKKLKSAISTVKNFTIKAVFGEDVLDLYTKGNIAINFFKKHMMKGTDLLKNIEEKDRTFRYPHDFEKNISTATKDYTINGYAIEALTAVKASSFILVTRPTLRKLSFKENIKILNLENSDILNIDAKQTSTRIRNALKEQDKISLKNDLPKSIVCVLRKVKIYSRKKPLRK